MIILGIETSCDETALAIYDEHKGLLGHVVHSQMQQLIKYGGVLPEVAARYHVQYLTPLLHKLLESCKIKVSEIDYIAYTKGPGLVGSLLTGIAFAKGLSLALKIPSIGINHLEGHLLSCFITEYNNLDQVEYPIDFPFLALLVSGGHTMLIKANSLGKYAILGETLDDAAGEALDKTAKLLGLNPPTGKTLAELANSSTAPQTFHFPRPLINQKNLNFSFSGLKTAALTQIKKLSAEDLINHKADLAHAFQEAVMDTLVIKCQQALIATKLNKLVIVGGVSANLVLREKLNNLTNNLYNIELTNKKIKNQFKYNLKTPNNIKVFFPKLEFCTDNGAMIAIAGLMRAKKGLRDQNLNIEAYARWDLESF